MDNNKLYFIEDMFNSIAHKYDLLNRLLSFNFDRYWRSRLVLEAKNFSAPSVLDVACGTGDVAIEFMRQKGILTNIIGVDFSEKMLAIARKKSCNNINLILGDALFLPFSDESFDIISIAFGIRNIENKTYLLKEFYSLLRPGGLLLILELSIPENKLIRKAFMYYFKYILPRIGNLFSKNFFAYSYLPASVINFPNKNKVTSMLLNSGFSKVLYKKITMGIVSLFIAHKS